MNPAAQTIRFWFNNARPHALPQSMFPAFLAIIFAVVNVRDFSLVSLLLGLAAVVGVACGHLGINLLDDYFDYRCKTTEAREELTHKGFRARLGKCAYIQSGRATLPQLLGVSFLFCGMALLCGGIISWQRGPVILFFAATVALLGYFYSGSPLRLSYRGLGEAVIAVVFGPLLMGGVYYAIAGEYNSGVIFIGFSVGLLVMNIVYTHAIMDYEPDKQVGKMTLAVLLDDKKKMLLVQLLMLLMAFGLIVVAVALRFLPVPYLLLLLTAPMAVSLYKLMRDFVRDPYQKIQPKFWMGPMRNWTRVQETGIEWFMIRWYLARNLISAFCLILIIVTLGHSFF